MRKKSSSLFICLFLSIPALYSQGDAPPASWVYATAEDFVNDNRQFAGEYTVSLAKGESRYKDSLKLVYAAKHTGGKGENDMSNKAWGIVSDGRLYVNNQVLNGEKGYSKSFSTGRYHLFFVRLKESPASRKNYGYGKDEVRFYGKEQSKDRGRVNVGGIPVGLGSATFILLPVVADRETGEMKAYTQAYIEQLGIRHPDVAPVPMNEARGVRLIEYFKGLNSLK